MKMINVIIADDHPLIREGISKVIERNTDIKMIGEAEDGQKLLDLLKEKKPDILVLDITMPGKSGRLSRRAVMRLARSSSLMERGM